MHTSSVINEVMHQRGLGRAFPGSFGSSAPRVMADRTVSCAHGPLPVICFGAWIPFRRLHLFWNQAVALFPSPSFHIRPSIARCCQDRCSNTALDLNLLACTIAVTSYSARLTTATLLTSYLTFAPALRNVLQGQAYENPQQDALQALRNYYSCNAPCFSSPECRCIVY